MELTDSNSNTKVSKRGTRHRICALRQALMGSHFGVLWGNISGFSGGLKRAKSWAILLILIIVRSFVTGKFSDACMRAEIH